MNSRGVIAVLVTPSRNNRGKLCKRYRIARLCRDVASGFMQRGGVLDPGAARQAFGKCTPGNTEDYAKGYGASLQDAMESASKDPYEILFFHYEQPFPDDPLPPEPQTPIATP